MKPNRPADSTSARVEANLGTRPKCPIRPYLGMLDADQAQRGQG